MNILLKISHTHENCSVKKYFAGASHTIQENQSNFFNSLQNAIIISLTLRMVLGQRDFRGPGPPVPDEGVPCPHEETETAKVEAVVCNYALNTMFKNVF